MSMLGAQLDDLSSLSNRLQTTSGDVGSVQQQAVSLTSRVVSNVTEAAQTALNEITTQMDLMAQSVTAASSQADATQWTGANADRFRQAAMDFQGAITQAGSTTNDTFAQFLSTASSLSAMLETYVSQLSTSLSNAQESANQMSSAVEGQRSNLDQVMNQGLSVN